jgi:hypothetical protein
MSEWLLDRLYEHKDQPTKRFAFQGTINWLRALSIGVSSDNFEPSLNVSYKKIQRRKVNPEADTLVFENTLLALHNIAALEQMDKVHICSYAVCRSAIVSWYYAIYFSSKAMIAAASGSHQENHSKTAKVWLDDIVASNFAVYPFDLNLVSLVKKDCDNEIKSLRSSNNFNLNKYPENEEEAFGALISYLNGTRDYRAWEIEEQVRSSKEFKTLNVTNFRKKEAQILRDQKFLNHNVNFLSQAFRYRGKANYRDSIFLSYGGESTDKLELFIKDLSSVAKAFVRMSALYSQARVEKGTWDLFLADLKANANISIDTSLITK